MKIQDIITQILGLEGGLILDEEQLGKILETVIGNADEDIKDITIIELTLKAIKKAEE